MCVHQNPSPSVDLLKFPYVAMVVLPNIRRREFERQSMDQVLQSDEVLLRDDLEDGLEQRLKEMRRFPAKMTLEMIDLKCRIVDEAAKLD